MSHEQQSLVSTTSLSVSTAEGLGRANAGLILSAVLAEGSIARAELADRVGLTRATVTRVVSRLTEMGLLVEGSPRRDSPGRACRSRRAGRAGSKTLPSSCSG